MYKEKSRSIREVFMGSFNLANKIYQKILADIVELRLVPGDFLLERNIAEKLGVSRSPVREAIKRLIQEGWLIAEDRHRPIVKGFSLKEGTALFQFRHMAELFALDWAFENGLSKNLAGQLDLYIRKMREVAKEQVKFIRADVDFHTAIVNAVDNEFLTRAWITVGNELVRMVIYGMDYFRTVDKIIDEHENLIQSMWENDRMAAAQMLILHHENIFEGIKRQLLKSKQAVNDK
jgi:DNA-binding GntR family transcriptional regulator